MQKIMFNDMCYLTHDVLMRLKKQTRRVIPEKILDRFEMARQTYMNCTSLCDDPINPPKLEDFSPYKVGDEIAIAQSYFDIYMQISEHSRDKNTEDVSRKAGWHNKMFVKAEDMPHRIRITKVRAQHLQDISDEDCLAEGIKKIEDCLAEGVRKVFFGARVGYAFHYGDKLEVFDEPRVAYAKLIDKVGKKGTWDSNPMVYAYDFELIK